MSESVVFTVFGKPEPGGSKRGFARGRHVAIVDANKNAKPWKAAVSATAAEVMHGRSMMTGAVRATFTFYRVRPPSHYGSGRNADKLKPSAPAYWTTKPDALKLARPCEDAMTGIVYVDDALIVDEHLAKRWGSPARCEITIEQLEPKEPTQ